MRDPSIPKTTGWFGNPGFQTERQETHEGQPVSNLILGLLIRQFIEGVKDKDFKHDQDSKGRSFSLLPLGVAEDCH
ncbi:MAG: hypothetical protein MRJ67_02045 [Nitrospirales bacterium]|nr:hypothetical protein [Nitrospirales bacterium]